MKVFMHLLINLALFILGTHALIAQSYNDAEISGENLKNARERWGYFSIRQSFQPKDYILGFEGGMIEVSKQILLYGSFDVRPFKKRVEEEIANNFYHQYSETRFVAGIGAEWQKFFTARSGLFVNSTLGYSWGDYKGTIRTARKAFIGIPRLGYIYDTGKFVWLKVGYEYHDTFNDLQGKHRLFFGVNFAINQYTN